MLKRIITIFILSISPFFIWAKKELNFTYWGSTFEKKAVEDVIDDFNLLDDGTFTIEFFLYVRALNGGDPSYADYFGVFDGGSNGLLIYQIGSNLDVYICKNDYISCDRYIN